MHRSLPSVGAPSHELELALALAAGPVAVALFVLSTVALVCVAERREDPRGWGKYVGSIRALTAKVVAIPCDLGAVLALARELRDAGDLERASSELEIADVSCKLKPTFYQLAREIHLQQRDFSAVMRDDHRLFGYQPTRAEHEYAAGQRRESVGLLERAAASYAEVIRIDPLFPYAIDRLASIYLRTGRYASVERLRHFETAMKCARLPEGVTRQHHCQRLSRYPDTAPGVETLPPPWPSYTGPYREGSASDH